MPVASTDERLQRLRRERNLAGWVPVRLLAQDGPCVECRGRAEHDVDSVAIRCQGCAGTGLRLRPWAELAAYAGAEWAWEALGPCTCDLFQAHLDEGDGCVVCGGPVEGEEGFCAVGGPLYVAECVPWCSSAFLPMWLNGLSRWGREVQVRAAVAAARVALVIHCRDHWEQDGCGVCQELDPEEATNLCPELRDPRRAIEAAEAWLACPCEEHARDAWGFVLGPTVPPGAYWWVHVCSSVYAAQGLAEDSPVAGGALGLWSRTATDGCARLAGEPAVRSATQSALVAYALERLGWDA